jgi:hypothetical protein
MAKGDFKVINMCARQPFRIAASATRGYVGEPMINTATHSSGVASANTIVVAVDDDVTVVTEQFVGVLAKDMEVNSAGTVVAHRTNVDVPFAQITRIEAAVKTASTADTETEAIGLLHDIYMIDLTSSTYTWDAAGADTAGFTALWYNVARAALQCVVDPRAVARKDIT